MKALMNFVIIALIVTIIYQASGLYLNKPEIHVDAGREQFIKDISKEQVVIKASYDGNVLNIFVVDDHTDRKGLAVYYCSEAKSKGIDLIGVNVVEFASKNDRVLASSKCSD